MCCCRSRGTSVSLRRCRGSGHSWGYLDGLLPLPEPSALAQRDRARRLYRASEGVVAYLMELARRATYLAVVQGRNRLDESLLAVAFDQRLAGTLWSPASRR